MALPCFKNAASASAVAACADAVVVGSALVRKVEENANSGEQINKAVAALLGEMRQAMDAA